MELVQTSNDVVNLAGITGSYPEKIEHNVIEQSSFGTCPNRYAHASAFPGYGREICPHCHKIYVNR
jgi:hypothetical protein